MADHSRPAIGYRSGEQIRDIVGNYGYAIILLEGRAFMVVNMRSWPDGSFTVYMADRYGRGYTEAIGPGEKWYVTRKSLVNWPD